MDFFMTLNAQSGTLRMLLGALGIVALLFGVRKESTSEYDAPPQIGLMSESIQTTNKSEITGCLGFCPTAPVRREVPNPVARGDEVRIAPAVVRVSNTHTLGGSGRLCTEKGSGVCLGGGSGSNGEQGGKIFFLTAAHIFSDGTGNVSIRRIGGGGAEATVELIDPLWDIALLSAKIDGMRPLRLASAAPKIGDATRIVGFGPDDTFRVTRGRVVGYSQPSRHTTYETLKTSGAVRRGDSGGPMLAEDDTLLGVVWGTDGVCSYGTYCVRIRQILWEKIGIDFAGTAQDQTLIPRQTPTEKTPGEEAPPAKPESEARPKAADNKVVVDIGIDNKVNKDIDSGIDRNFDSVIDRDVVNDIDSDINKAAGQKRQKGSAGGDLKSELAEKAAGKLGDLLLRVILPALGVSVPGGALAAWTAVKILHHLRKRRRKRRQKASNAKVSSEKAAPSDTVKNSSTLVDQFNDYANELNELYQLNGRNTAADATLGRLYDTELAAAENSSDAALAEIAAKFRRKIKKELCRIHSEVPVPTTEND